MNRKSTHETTWLVEAARRAGEWDFQEADRDPPDAPTVRAPRPRAFQPGWAIPLSWGIVALAVALAGAAALAAWVWGMK